MPHGLDHVVHSVRDLDRAADVYHRLGFAVGARNRHPWGTHNRIVQLPGFFIELLAVGESESIQAPIPGVFSFGAFNRAFLARGEGLSMLVLESRDAAEDADRFRGSGIGAFDLFRFEREGRKPDGSVVKVGFSLAFAQDPEAPATGFFVCQQHHPENFWNPAYQDHLNTASAVAGVVLAAADPQRHQAFLAAFTGEPDLDVSAAGISVATSRGAIGVMDPAALRLEYGVEPPDVSGGGRIAAVRFAVRDLAAARAALSRGGIEASERRGRLVVGPEAAHGATMVFEAEPSRR